MKLWNRILASLLAVSLCCTMLPVQIFAAEDAETEYEETENYAPQILAEAEAGEEYPEEVTTPEEASEETPEEASEEVGLPEEAIPEETASEEEASEAEIISGEESSVNTPEEPGEEVTEELAVEETVALAATVASGVCGDNLTWTLDDEGTLTISGTGPMLSYGMGVVPWFDSRSAIKTVVINSGVTRICRDAFWECTSLTNVTIPNSVTSIGDYAFSGCTRLTEITIPDSVMSIGDATFLNTGLISIIIPESVSYIGDAAFCYCTELTSVVIPKGVTRIEHQTFYNCKSLTSATIPNSVTSIGDTAFEGCSGLKTIIIPDSVVNIGKEAFYGCRRLTNITIGSGVTSIGTNAFYDCTGLTAVYIDNLTAWSEISFGSNWANPLYYANKLYVDNDLLTELVIPNGVTSIGSYVFYKYTNLTSVTIPDSVTTIGSSAFHGCTGLKSVDIPASITDIGKQVFQGCTGLADENGFVVVQGVLCDYIGYSETIEIPDGVTSIGDYAFAYCLDLTSVTIPDSVTSISESAFEGCSGLTDENGFVIIRNVLYDYSGDAEIVTIPQGVTSIGNAAFAYCLDLTSVTIPESATKIGDCAFAGCSGLKSVTIPNSVTSIGNYAFQDCSELRSVTIPDSVASIGDHAFWGCCTLKYVTIGDGVTSIGEDAFSCCESLLSVYIDDIIAWLGISFANDESNPLCYAKELYVNNELLTELIVPDGTTKIGDYAFYRTGLTSVTIPESVTTIGESAFNNCTELTSITIANGVTSIGDYAFYGSGLTSVTIPESVTTLGRYAFAWSNLKSVSIPRSVISIGEKAFASCFDLQKIVFEGNSPFIGHGCFGDVIATVFYPVEDSTWTRLNKVSYGGILSWIGLLMSITPDIQPDVLMPGGEAYTISIGDVLKLPITITPEVLQEQVVWSVSEPELLSVAADGTVTGLAAGTGYVKASLKTESGTYSARFRVDVLGDTIEEELLSVELLTPKPTVEIYKTAYTRLTILPVLKQNTTTSDLPDSGLVSGIVRGARFSDNQLNDYFTLRVVDDRTLEVIPIEGAIAAAQDGQLKNSLQGTLLVNVCGKEFEAGTITLTIKKSVPSLKAAKLTVNTGLALPAAAVAFTGDTVTGAELASASDGFTAVGTTIIYTGRAAKASGTVVLSCAVEGWAIPAVVKVSVKAAYTAPKLIFSQKSVTLAQGRYDKATVQVAVSPAEYAESPVTLIQVEMKDGKLWQPVENGTLLSAQYTDGILTLRAPQAHPDGKAHEYRITFEAAGKQFTYNVKTLAATSAPAPVLSLKGTLNNKLAGSYVTATAGMKNYHTDIGERYTVESIFKYKAGNAKTVEVNEDVTGLFEITQDGRVFTIALKEAETLEKGYAYRARLAVDLDNDGNPDVRTDVAMKVSLPAKAPKAALTAKTSGNIDLVRPESFIGISAGVSNYYGEITYTLSFTQKSGKTVTQLTEEEAPFSITRAGGSFTLKAGSGLKVTDKYSVTVQATLADGTCLSKTLSLSVKQGKVTVKANTSTLTLYRNDRYSRAAFLLNIPDGTVGEITRVEPDTAAAKTLRVVDCGEGSYAITYKDNLLPAAFRSTRVKLNVYVGESLAGTVTVTVSFK